MKIYDCFTFYNEYDLLEIRLEELWNTVDYFVIGEASTTFRGNPKRFNLEDNWSRFEKYASKIRYVRITDMPTGDSNWAREFHQRAALGRGLFDMQPDDLIIVSDCDEIPRATAVEYVKNGLGDHDRYIMAVPIFYFKLNNIMTHPLSRQINIKITRGRAFTDAHRERDSWNYIPGTIEIEHGGWHFCYFGDTEFARTKIQSFSHSETDVPWIVDNLDVEGMVAAGKGIGWDKGAERFERVQVDEYFPKSITSNINKYKNAIAEGATRTVYDFYPKGSK
jgi:beta-1,4-mannosyl-glycoprotein beta-1,4-N-acetylglucosaminyltransferase